MGRAVKVGGPAGGLVGLLADQGAQAADLAMYVTIGCGAITLMAGFIWFGKRLRKLRAALAGGKITQEELEKATESNGWPVAFAFGLVATVILGLVMTEQKLMPKEDEGGKDRGVIATLEPSLQKMQDSLFKAQRELAGCRQQGNSRQG